MKKAQKARSTNIQNTSGTKSAQSKNPLEAANRNLKRIIAGLSVALIACVVYILANPTQSSPPPNRMNYSQPASEPVAAPAPRQNEADIGTGNPVSTPQPDASTGAVSTMNQTVPVPPSASEPADGQTATLNPPHGQPGHRCDVPVGSPLP